MFELGGATNSECAFNGVEVLVKAQFQEREIPMYQKAKVGKMAVRAFLGMALLLSTVNLLAQETRKPISNPVPRYPELAKNLRLSGVVKVQIVIAPDGKITSTKVLGGHPLFVSSVEDTLKNWKYAPANTETTTQLEFNFHP
jgi:TonB family protein